MFHPIFAAVLALVLAAFPIAWSSAATDAEEARANAANLIARFEESNVFTSTNREEYRGVDRLGPDHVMRLLREVQPSVVSMAHWIVFQAWAEDARTTIFRREAGGRRRPILYSLLYSVDLRQAQLLQAVFKDIDRLTDSSIESEREALDRFSDLIKNVTNEHQAEFIRILIQKRIPFSSQRLPQLKSFIGAINGPKAGAKAAEFFGVGSLPQIETQIEILRLIDQVGTEEQVRELERRIEFDRRASLNEFIDLILVLDPPNQSEHWRRIISAMARLDGESFFYLGYARVRGESPRQDFLRSIHRPLMELINRSLRETDRKALEAAALAREPLPAHLIEKIQTQTVENPFMVPGFFRETEKLIREQFKVIDASLTRYFSSPKVRLEPAHFQRFFEILVEVYFRRLPDSMRLRILRGLLGETKSPDDTRMFRVVIHRSGPNLQKLMQSIAREPELNPEFAQTLKSLETEVDAPPFNTVMANLTAKHPDLFGGPTSPYRFLQEKPYAGTIALTYRTARKLRDGSFSRRATRVLRPGIVEELIAEEKLLRAALPEIKSAPALRGTSFEHFELILEPILQATKREVDFTGAIKAQPRAGDVYSRQYAFTTASKLVDVIVPPVDIEFSRSDVMDQEFIEGERFDEFFQDRPGIKAEVIEAFAAIWWREALMTSGFHHADPHQGNLLFRVGPNQKIQVVLLDYGLTDEVQPVVRRSLILLSQALKSGDQARIKVLTSDILTGAKASDALVETALKRGHTDVKGYIEYLLQQGIAVRPEVISLNRGMKLIDQLLRTSGSRQSLQQISMQVAREMIAADMKVRATSFGRKQLTPLNMSDILHLYKSRNNPVQTNSAAAEIDSGSSVRCTDLFRRVSQ